MSTIQTQIDAFLEKPRAVCPDIATAVSDGQNSLSLSVEFSKDRVLLLIEAEGRSGSLNGVVLGNNTITRVDGRLTVADLVRDVVATLRDRTSLQMEIAHTTNTHCDSWDQVDMHNTPTMSFGAGGDGCGSAIPSAFHPEIEALVSKYHASKNVVVNVSQRRPLFISQLNISDLQPSTLMAWGLGGQKSLTITLSLHPTEFLNVVPLVDVRCETAEEVGKSRSNIIRHLQHLLNNFARFVSQQYQASTPDSNNNNNLAGCALVLLNSKSNKRIQILKDASGNEHKNTLSTSTDIVEILMAYLRVRLPTITECCVVCDQLHLATNHQPTVSTVCTRSICLFVFQRLNVGKDATRDLSLHPAVLEMLLTFTRAAVSSSRWQTILTPFPTVFGKTTTEGFGESNKDISAVRNIFRKCQYNTDFQTLTVPFAAELQSWIIASNASFVQPLSTRIPFINTGKHFILIQSSQKHAAAYEKNRVGKKVVYAFHGSNAENWHSILRNGLVNASGTSLQVNGAAYGNGIYLSPDLHTSQSYMRTLTCDVGTSDCVKDPPATDFSLKPTRFLCVALCEVIDEEIKKSGSIWVQPREDYLMTRYILVFDGDSVPSISLENTDNIQALHSLTQSLQMASA